MNIYQTNKQIINLVLFAVFAVIGVVLNPAYASAKMLSLAYLDVFQVVNFSTKETSIAYVGFETTTTEEVDVEKQDKINRLDSFFAKRDMPLAGYGAKFVEIAEKCDIDWRLLPAIGVRESSGGKHLRNNNPFGWGSANIKFNDFNDAIENVSDHLCGLRESTAKYYKDKTQAQKLWYYNGSVLPSYPKEVVEIMEMM
ncbi:MAG: hypothetical protein WC725_00960 [Patescibacteria group bacterium]|jgi:hypothetical protein